MAASILAQPAVKARVNGRAVLTAAAIAAVGMAACGDPYVRTNPYDPDVSVALTISGPDTVFSHGEWAQYAVSSVPAFSDTSYTWLINNVTTITPNGPLIEDGAKYFRPNATGIYVADSPPVEPATMTVTVVAAVGKIDTTINTTCSVGICPALHGPAYRHLAYKTVVLTDRVTTIRLRCPATHMCDTVSAGGSWSVWVDGFDPLGWQPGVFHDPASNPPSGTPLATFLVRDTAIASMSPDGIRAATIVARQSGSTWIVAARNALLDSLQLVVR